MLQRHRSMAPSTSLLPALPVHAQGWGCSAQWRGAAGGEGLAGRAMATGLAAQRPLTSQGNGCCSAPHPVLPVSFPTGCSGLPAAWEKPHPWAALGSEGAPLLFPGRLLGPWPHGSPFPGSFPAPSAWGVLGTYLCTPGEAAKRHRPAARCFQLGLPSVMGCPAPWGSRGTVPAGGCQGQGALTGIPCSCTACPSWRQEGWSCTALCGAAFHTCIKRKSDY